MSPPPDQAFRWRSLREAPRGVWLLTAAFLLLLMVATAVWPPYRGPDEPQHVDLAVALDRGFSPLWAPATREVSTGAATAGVLPNTRIGVPQQLADRQTPPRAERPGFVELGGDVPTTQNNQLVQHPPLYYLVLTGVLRLVPGWETQPMDLIIGVLRLVGVLLVAPLPLLAWATARRLTRSPTVPVLAALGVVGVPQLVHITAGVNNDALQNLAAGLCTLVAVLVATGDTTRRTAVAAGSALGLGLLAKGLLLVFVGVLLAAYALAWWRAPGRRLHVVGSTLLAMTVAGVVGGWWWLRNLVTTGQVQPAGAVRPTEVLRGWGPEAVVWAEDLFRFVLIRYWFDHPSGSDVGVSVTASYVVTAVVGLLVLLALLLPPPDVRRATVLLLLLPVGCLAVLVTAGSWESFTLGYDQPALQGRYLFPGLPAVSVVVALGLHRLLGAGRPRLATAAVLVWVLAAQALGLASALRLYWWPADGQPGTLVRGMVRVLPWPGPSLPVLLLLLAAVTVTAVVLLLRDASAPAPTDVPADHR